MGSSLGNNYGKFYSFQSKPVVLDAQWVVASTAGTGTSSVKGQGVSNVYMHSSSPSAGHPNPANGYALVRLAYNYTRAYAAAINALPPLTGSDLAINGSALTAGVPYQITAAGHSEAGTATIAPVADSAGNLAGTYFLVFDNYGNTFCIWFSVSGVGSRPNLGAEATYGTSGLHYVQQSITTGDTAGTIGTALVITINALPSGVSGVFSFTAAGTTTVTIVSTQHNPYQPLPGAPVDGVSPLGTGFTFALTKYTSNLIDWQQVGVPAGVSPVVGVGFIATATGYSTGGGSTGTVKAYGSTGIVGFEVLGDPNLSLGPIPMSGSPNVGGWFLIKCLAPTFAGTALGSHTHDMKVIGGQAASTTNDVAVYGGDTLGKELATDATIVGANSATKGGVVAVTAGTPAGTVTFAAGAPTDGTIIKMQILLEGASLIGGNNE